MKSQELITVKFIPEVEEDAENDKMIAKILPSENNSYIDQHHYFNRRKSNKIPSVPYLKPLSISENSPVKAEEEQSKHGIESNYHVGMNDRNEYDMKPNTASVSNFQKETNLSLGPIISSKDSLNIELYLP